MTNERAGSLEKWMDLQTRLRRGHRKHSWSQQRDIRCGTTEIQGAIGECCGQPTSEEI